VSLLFSAIFVATALRGTLDVSNRAQLATRAGGGLAEPTLDADTSPEVKLAVRSRRWELTVDYAPRFTDSLAGADRQSYVLQQGRLGARYQDRRGSVSLYEDSGYGRLSLLTLGAYPGAGATPGTAPIAAPPTTALLDYAWSRTGIVARLIVSRRWGVNATGELALSGGASASAQATLPFQTAIRVGLGADYAASRRDHLTAQVDTSRATFSTGLEDTLVQGKLSWRHDLDSTFATTLAAGIGGSTSRAETSPVVRSAAAPIVEAGLTYRPRAGEIELGLGVKLSPVIDAFSGRVDQRIEGSANVAWTPTRDLSIQAQLGVARAIPWGEGVALSIGFGAITASYHVNDVLQLDAGGRSAWIKEPGIDSPPQWMAFTAATVRIPTLRF
jgi:hypothetical protein